MTEDQEQHAQELADVGQDARVYAAKRKELERELRAASTPADRLGFEPFGYTERS
jgi:hypothetical protein